MTILISIYSLSRIPGTVWEWCTSSFVPLGHLAAAQRSEEQFPLNVGAKVIVNFFFKNHNNNNKNSDDRGNKEVSGSKRVLLIIYFLPASRHNIFRWHTTPRLKFKTSIQCYIYIRTFYPWPPSPHLWNHQKYAVQHSRRKQQLAWPCNARTSLTPIFPDPTKTKCRAVSLPRETSSRDFVSGCIYLPLRFFRGSCFQFCAIFRCSLFFLNINITEKQWP